MNNLPMASTLDADIVKINNYLSNVDGMDTSTKIRFARMLHVGLTMFESIAPVSTQQVTSTVDKRKSCLKCAEKHIGAALVKLEEVQFGYRYKVFIVGHLNEAEEETISDYPALANVIRQERLNYQAGKGVDSDLLLNLLEETKDASETSDTNNG